MGADAVHAQGAEHREVAAVVEWFAHRRPLAARGTSGGPGHRQGDAQFVQANQLFSSQRVLARLVFFFVSTLALATCDRSSYG